MSEDGPRDRALALMQELAGGGPLGETMPVSEVGFDSLAFAELGAALDEGFGVDLTAVDLDGSSTVGEVLRAVDVAGRRRGAVELRCGPAPRSCRVRSPAPRTAAGRNGPVGQGCVSRSGRRSSSSLWTIRPNDAAGRSRSPRGCALRSSNNCREISAL